MILLFSTLPIQNIEASEGGEYRPSAWIADWSAEVSKDLHLHDDHITHHWDGSYGYDSAGNLYIAYVDDDVSISPVTTQFAGYSTSERGIYVFKYTPQGDMEWIKRVSSTRNDCDHYNRGQCKLMGLHVTGEDTFYMVWQTYNSATFDFGNGVTVYVNGHQMAVAHHSPTGWDYAEATTTRGWTNDYVIEQMLDDAGNLIIAIKEDASGSVQEYTIRAYDAEGGKWARTFETYYGNSNYRRLPLLLDTDDNMTHVFTTTRYNAKYDSQTTSCPENSQDDYCHIWITIDSNGIKQSSVEKKYTSMSFWDWDVEGGEAYLIGTTQDHVRGNNGQSNFTGMIADHGDYTGYVAKLDSDGEWGYHEAITHTSDYNLNEMFEHDDRNFARVYAHSDGDVTYAFTSWDGGFYDDETFAFPGGSSIDLYQTYLNLDSDGNYLSNTTFGYENVDIWSSHHAAKPVMGPNGYFAAWFQGRGGISDVVLPNGTKVLGGMAFISYQTGELLDFEPINTWDYFWAYPMAISPNGDLMAWSEIRISNTWYRYFSVWAVDIDADDVGNNDNCPTAYNPGQEDHDGDSFGDVCDNDDDDDLIPDTVDECPRGETGWESGRITDHDSDGCRDSHDEDLDDDGDSVADDVDLCPKGVLGLGYDTDGDGCKDQEDDDDDNDGVNDGSDECNPGEMYWLSGSLTDHDGDGCRDIDEDYDDDNDGVPDEDDSCPRGITNWIANRNTDFDQDGCQDGTEDLDCCDVNTGSGGAIFYYVCPGSALVVDDPSLCASVNSPGSNSSDGESNTGNNFSNVGMVFYYVCPGSLEVVADPGSCPEALQITEDSTVTTIVIDPSTDEETDEYFICPNGQYIVLNGTTCPESVGDDSNQIRSGDTDSTTVSLILYVAIASMVVSLGALLTVLFRKGGGKQNLGVWSERDSDALFNSKGALPPINEWKQGQEKPPVSVSGTYKDGFEWIEWPTNSENHWYREEGNSGEWMRFEG